MLPLDEISLARGKILDMWMGFNNYKPKPEIYDHLDLFGFCNFYFQFVMQSSCEESVIKMTVTRDVALDEISYERCNSK